MELLVVFIAAIILVYNSLVKKKVTCEQAWRQIDVQLMRRHDLIPELVEIVRGYTQYEKQVLEDVTVARSAAQNSKSMHELSKNEIALTESLRRVFLLSESYPALKASENFLVLQEEIVTTENRISFARQFYNDSVFIFNTALEQFPGNVVAPFGRFKKRGFFQESRAGS